MRSSLFFSRRGQKSIESPQILSHRKSQISIYQNLKIWLTHLILSDVFNLSLVSADRSWGISACVWVHQRAPWWCVHKSKLLRLSQGKDKKCTPSTQTNFLSSFLLSFWQAAMCFSSARRQHWAVVRERVWDAEKEQEAQRKRDLEFFSEISQRGGNPSETCSLFCAAWGIKGRRDRKEGKRWRRMKREWKDGGDRGDGKVEKRQKNG